MIIIIDVADVNPEVTGIDIKSTRNPIDNKNSLVNNEANEFF